MYYGFRQKMDTCVIQTDYNYWNDMQYVETKRVQLKVAGRRSRC